MYIPKKNAPFLLPEEQKKGYWNVSLQVDNTCKYKKENNYRYVLV